MYTRKVVSIIVMTLVLIGIGGAFVPTNVAAEVCTVSCVLGSCQIEGNNCQCRCAGFLYLSARCSCSNSSGGGGKDIPSDEFLPDPF